MTAHGDDHDRVICAYLVQVISCGMAFLSELTIVLLVSENPFTFWCLICSFLEFRHEVPDTVYSCFLAYINIELAHCPLVHHVTVAINQSGNHCFTFKVYDLGVFSNESFNFLGGAYVDEFSVLYCYGFSDGLV